MGHSQGGLWKNAYKGTDCEELRVDMRGHVDYIVSSLSGGSWHISWGGGGRFPPSYCHAPLQMCRLDTQLATNSQGTNMSSVTSPQQSDNDGPRPPLVISVHDTNIRNLAYLPDGRRVVISSDDRTVKVWNLGSGEQEGTSIEQENVMVDVAVTREGTKIISSDPVGKVRVWDVESTRTCQGMDSSRDLAQDCHLAG